MAHQILTTEMTDEEFDRHVMRILSRELGAGGYARYLAKYRSGQGDYTRDRHQWLDKLTMDEILAGIKEIEARTTRS